MVFRGLYEVLGIDSGVATFKAYIIPAVLSL